MLIQTHRPASVREIVTHHTVLGIEVEKMRVNHAGYLSKEPFPCSLESEIAPYVEREFFNAQIEFALPRSADVTQNIARAQHVVEALAHHLAPEEHLWPYSSPPRLPASLPIDLVSEFPRDTHEYRRRLCEIYDLRRLMHTGVHINLSFDSKGRNALLSQRRFDDSDALYMHLAQQLLLHRWLFTWLFGATPLSFPGYFDNKVLWRPARSIRCSSLGFPTSIMGDYRSPRHYVEQIRRAIDLGKLVAPAQYYESVRLKSATGNHPDELLENGISHLELRTFDLNPLTLSGISEDQLRFVQLFTVYLTQRPSIDERMLMQGYAASRRLNERVALEDPRHPSCCQALGLKILTELRDFAHRNELPQAYGDAINRFLLAERYRERSLSCQVLKQHPMRPYIG